MSHLTVTTDQQLEQFCRQLAHRDWIGLDTEFVSERTYRPVLCLVQVVTEERMAIIDALAVKDLTPFWQVVSEGPGETIVHAGRSEVEFCLGAVGRPPAGLFDVQIAAGLVGVEYPASLRTLAAKLLGETTKEEETRTDWCRRPLSSRQIHYALDDVRHLASLRDTIRKRLDQLHRHDWLEEEMRTWTGQVQQAFSQERWWKVSGNSGLDRRGLAIVRELWRWREREAERRNSPPRRVLRDDLIIELAARKTAELKRIKALRGLERGDLKRRLPEIAESIRHALELPEHELPEKAERESPRQLSVLGQFLHAALGNVCRRRQLAPGLVGTPNDVRELIAYRTGQTSCRQPPRLARGWRGQLVGRLFDDLLAGKLAVRIGDPASDQPLLIEPADG